MYKTNDGLVGVIGVNVPYRAVMVNSPGSANVFTLVHQIALDVMERVYC